MQTSAEPIAPYREAACYEAQVTSRLAENRNVRAVAIAGMAPAVLVVIGHALLGERLHLLERAGSLRLLERKDAHQLVAPRIVHLVELVPRSELGADRVPKQFHGLDALPVVDAARAAHV